MKNNTHTHTPNCRPNSAPSRTFGPLPSPCGRYWHSRVSSPMSICRMRMSLRTLDTFTRTTKCMWVAPESSPPPQDILDSHSHTFPILLFKGTAADARELSTGDIWSDVRVLAAERVESPQLPGNTSLSTAQESRL